MTSLICLVCRCNLKDGRLIKENEPFETDETEAEILIRGGIAKPVIKPEPQKETVCARVVEIQAGPDPYLDLDPSPQPQGENPPEAPEKIYAKSKRKR